MLIEHIFPNQYTLGAFFTSVLLPHANPPPGAIKQIVGLNRPGNNYAAAEPVSWYQNTPKITWDHYRIKGVDGSK